MTTINRFLYWHGDSDSEWPTKAVESLKSNEWTDSLYINGKLWSRDEERRAAAVQIMNALCENVSVTTFMICQADMGNVEMEALTQAMESKQGLENISLRSLNHNNVRMIVPAGVFNKPSVKKLTLEKCALNADRCESLGRMIRESQDLTTLNISDVDMHENFSAFAAAIASNTSLQYLTLRGMTWDQENVSVLMNAIAVNTSIVSLYLEGMNFSGRDSARYIARMLSQNKHLEFFSLRKNNLDGEAIKMLCRGLEENTSLKTLYLSSNCIQDTGAYHLAAALQKNSTLTYLCLSRCQISAGGCKEIARGLNFFRGLVTMNLHGNDVIGCASQFVESMHSNTVVRELFESMSHIVASSDEAEKAAWREVEFYLRLNAGKRRALSEHVSLPLSLFSTVLATASNEPDVMFHYLQQMPGSLVSAANTPTQDDTIPKVGLLEASAGNTFFEQFMCGSSKHLSWDSTMNGSIRLLDVVATVPVQRAPRCA